MMRHARHRLGARAPRHPHRHHRRRHVVRQHLPHPRHQPRRPARLPRHARRAGRLDGPDGRIWWMYGIGLKGPEPTWEAVPGATVIQDTELAAQGGRARRPARRSPTTPTSPRRPTLRRTSSSIDEGWEQLDESAPEFGQAEAAAGELPRRGADAFAAGEFKVTTCSTGGERFPKIGDSSTSSPSSTEPHYAVVEVAPLEQMRTEPGRAPAPPEIDATRQRQYVYMVRDLGARRQPAALHHARLDRSCSSLLCWLLHRRDRSSPRTAADKLVPAG